MLVTLKEHARGGKGDLQDHFYLLQSLLYHLGTIQCRPMQDIRVLAVILVLLLLSLSLFYYHYFPLCVR